MDSKVTIKIKIEAEEYHRLGDFPKWEEAREYILHLNTGDKFKLYLEDHTGTLKGRIFEYEELE